MKKLTSIVLLSLLCGVQQVAAHDDHDHKPITEQAAISLGKDVAAKLSVKDSGLGLGKLPETWAKVPAKNAKLHKKGDGYYIVAVANDTEKKTLYVLMSAEGEAYDANFTGEFKKLK
jgi:Family of unknown function (DUF6488)